MPSYLSHLALRVSGAKPAVRPRIPSLFEALPGAGIAAAAEPEAAGVRVVDRERVAPPPLAPMVPAEAQVRVPAQPAPREAAVVPEPQPARQEDPGRQAAEIVPHEVTIAAPQRHERIAEAIGEKPAPLHLPPHAVVRPEVRAAPAGEESRSAVAHASAPPPREEPPRRMRTEVQQRPGVRAEPEKVAVEPRRAVAANIPAEPAAAIRPAQTLASQAEIHNAPRGRTVTEPGLHEEPAVQVTIGRLIVEAVMPAPATPPAPRPRATGPRLSLDDYLSQRRSQA